MNVMKRIVFVMNAEGLFYTGSNVSRDSRFVNEFHIMKVALL